MPRYSPLDAFHRARAAKMADFGGWEMPIEYPVASGGGVINEHTAVRERVALFDVSHLGKVRVSGTGAKEFLNSMLTNDLNRISAGRAQYTMMCNESGGVVDDLIAYLISDNEAFLVPNAANTSEVVKILKSNAPKDIQIENCHEKYGVLALQGPLAAETLLSIVSLPELDYMSFLEIELGGYSVIICRTGYTGEFGYEIIPKWSETESVWNLLLQAIEAKSGLVAGLGARALDAADLLLDLLGLPLEAPERALGRADPLEQLALVDPELVRRLAHLVTASPDRSRNADTSVNRSPSRVGSRVSSVAFRIPSTSVLSSGSSPYTHPGSPPPNKSPACAARRSRRRVGVR